MDRLLRKPTFFRLLLAGLICAGGLLALYFVLRDKFAASPEIILLQEIESHLTDFPDEIMMAGCWSAGRETINRFNEKLPVIVAALLAKPEAKTLSLEQVQNIFHDGTGQSLTLTKGDSEVVMGVLSGLYCQIGSHDCGGYAIYVFDHSGNFWAIEHSRQMLDVEWIEDRWIATVDVGGQAYCGSPNEPELWVISHQENGWAVTDRLLRLNMMQSMTHSFENGYRKMVATIKTISSEPPCEAIRQIPGYSTTHYSVVNTYSWMVDHYALIEETKPRATIVVFMLRDFATPDLSAVELTPFYLDGQTIPVAYWVDDWQPLCE